MRAPELRVSGYAAKPQQTVTQTQKNNFALAISRQVEIECSVKAMSCVQNAGLLRSSLIIFAKEICSRKTRLAGAELTQEIAILRQKWISRSLPSACLDNIINWCVGVYVAPPAAKTGACCYADGSCAVVTQAACTAGSGTYQGDDTDCDPNPCPQPCAWDYKMKITFSGYTGASNLDDFPILVHLTAANFDFTHAQAAGQDIRFMDSDLCPEDGTPLKHEIEKWDQAGEDAWIWVKVPRIDGGSATDYIYAFYGNAAAADGQDPTNVWDSGFRQVLHLKETAGTHQDSTSDNRDGTPAGDVTMGTATKLDGADTLGSDTGRITASETSITNKFTVEAWVYVTGTQGGYAGVIDHLNGHTDGCKILISSGGFGVDVAMHTPAYYEQEYNAPATFTNNWRHLVITYSGASVDYYQDGASFGSKNDTGNITGGTTDITWGWGSANSSYYHLTGSMDELRISDIARSADWIKADFQTQSETLQTYGAEQAV